MAELAVLPDFGKRSASIETAINRLSLHLYASDLTGQMLIGIVGTNATKYFLVAFEARKARALRKPPDSTSLDLQIYVSEDSAQDILRGKLSPLRAFLDGDLRFVGHEGFAVQVLRALATDRASILQVCHPRRHPKP